MRAGLLSALTAALILGAFGATAFASAPPKNTVLPAITPGTPEVGEPAFATTGTWFSEAPAHWLGGSGQLKSGEKVSVKAAASPITYAAVVGGLTGSFTCSTEMTGVSLENPTGGSSGVGNAELIYKSCTAGGSWSKCAIAIGSEKVPLKFALGLTEGKTKVAITPSGANLGTFTFSGSECPAALKGNYPVFGAINALYSNPTASIEFNATTSGGGALRLKNAIEGPKASASGNVVLTLTAEAGVTVSNGIAYSYSWNRCEATCSPIPGATKSSYVPVAVDQGKTLSVTVIATDANGSTSATSAPSGGVKGTPAWYLCGNTGEAGVYEDSSCTKKGASNPYSWIRATSIPFTSSNVVRGVERVPTIISWNFAGPVEVQCGGSTGKGTLTNTASQGVIEGYELTLSECSMVRPAACTLEGSTITLSKITARSSTEKSSKAANSELTLENGNTLFSYHINGCGIAGTYYFVGSLPAVFNNTGGILESEYHQVEVSKKLRVNDSNGPIVSMQMGSRFLAEGTKPVKLDIAP